MIGAYVTGAIGLGLAAVSAWLHVQGRDGSGWAFLAVCLIITSCNRSAA